MQSTIIGAFEEKRAPQGIIGKAVVLTDGQGWDGRETFGLTNLHGPCEFRYGAMTGKWALSPPIKLATKPTENRLLGCDCPAFGITVTVQAPHGIAGTYASLNRTQPIPVDLAIHSTLQSPFSPPKIGP